MADAATQPVKHGVRRVPAVLAVIALGIMALQWVAADSAGTGPGPAAVVAAVGALTAWFAGRRPSSDSRVTETAPSAAGTEARTRAVDERDRFARMLDALSTAIVLLDADGGTRFANRSARALLGDDDGTDSRPFGDRVESPHLQRVCQEGLAGRGVSEELQLGERRYFAQAFPWAQEGVLLVMQDLTRLHQLETVRRDFVANVSHELRTPVSVIRANAEAMLDGALEQPEVARSFAEASLRHAERLGHLIADLLDIARLEAGERSVVPQDVPVRAVLELVRESIASRAEAKNVSVVVEPSAHVVVADRQALEQVLVNLGDNAAKYTHEGGHVVLRSVDDADGVRIEVRDDGPGIEPQHRDRLFERFYRVDPGRSRDVGGTGLGLAIVKHLVHAMGGRVAFEPNEPRGSSFYLVLPSA